LGKILFCRLAVSDDYLLSNNLRGQITAQKVQNWSLWKRSRAQMLWEGRNCEKVVEKRVWGYETIWVGKNPDCWKYNQLQTSLQTTSVLRVIVAYLKFSA